MRFFEHIKKGILYSHVYFFILIFIFSLILFLVSILLFNIEIRSFIPIFIFLILWVIIILIMWVLVSFILALKTRNPRYTFQFIGIALIIVYPGSILFIALYYMLVPFPSDIQFPPEGIFEDFFLLSLPLGLLIAILG
ncbi:MAG: hypothetical protein JSV49_04380, partial [Thermoplasmata archaeon]